MIAIHPEYIIDEHANKKAVIIQFPEWEKLLEEFEEREFMRALIQGLTDVETGKEISLTEAKQRLGLK
jgi:hypothetical protein